MALCGRASKRSTENSSDGGGLDSVQLQQRTQEGAASRLTDSTVSMHTSLQRFPAKPLVVFMPLFDAGAASVCSAGQLLMEGPLTFPLGPGWRTPHVARPMRRVPKSRHDHQAKAELLDAISVHVANC